MFAWPKFHSSCPHSLWENDQNAKSWQNLESQWTVKSRSRLSIDGSFGLHSSRCMHEPSCMALALIVSEEMTYTQKLDKNLESQWTVKSSLRLSIDGSFELHSSRCMHDPSFMALALKVSEKKWPKHKNSIKICIVNEPEKVGKGSVLMITLSCTQPDVCMTHVLRV